MHTWSIDFTQSDCVGIRFTMNETQLFIEDTSLWNSREKDTNKFNSDVIVKSNYSYLSYGIWLQITVNSYFFLYLDS